MMLFTHCIAESSGLSYSLCLITKMNLEKNRIFLLTVTRSNEKVMCDCSTCTDRSSGDEVKALIFVPEVTSHQFVYGKISSVSWETASHNSLCTLEEARDASLILV